MSMNYEEVWVELKGTNDNVEECCVLDGGGNLLFTSGGWDLSADGGTVVKAWLNRGPRIEIQGIGFSVLRSEPEQFISKNVAGKGSVVGSITKTGNYLLVKLKPTTSERVGRDFFDVARAAAKV
ncbi:MAG: hypothetical protein ACTSUE_20905 [Promethearchaeota archaeon]